MPPQQKYVVQVVWLVWQVSVHLALPVQAAL
jgi:hypothetical protein